MSDGDIRSRVLPWLERWSIEDVPAAQPWVAKMFLRNYAADEYLVQHGQHSDVLYLLESGLVRRVRDGVRLLAKGELSAKIDLTVTGASKAAVAAVEKAGGKVTVSQAAPASE